jgi:hypothetical protein
MGLRYDVSSRDMTSSGLADRERRLPGRPAGMIPTICDRDRPAPLADVSLPSIVAMCAPDSRPPRPRQHRPRQDHAKPGNQVSVLLSGMHRISTTASRRHPARYTSGACVIFLNTHIGRQLLCPSPFPLKPAFLIAPRRLAHLRTRLPRSLVSLPRPALIRSRSVVHVRSAVSRSGCRRPRSTRACHTRVVRASHAATASATLSTRYSRALQPADQPSYRPNPAQYHSPRPARPNPYDTH